MAAKDQEPFVLTPMDSCAGSIRYVTKAFFFPRSNNDQGSIVRNLRSALAQTLNAIPPLGGSIQAITHAHQSGRLAITAAWVTADELLTVKDWTKTDFPTYQSLRAEHFPMVHIDYGVLLSPPKPEMPRRVFIAQANFIRGGLILATAIHHAYTDGGGFVSVINAWATYCRGDDGAMGVADDTLHRTRLMEGTGATTLVDDYPGYAYVAGFDNSAKLSALHQRLSQVFESSKNWIAHLLRVPISLGWRITTILTYFTQSKQEASDRNKDKNLLADEIFFFPREKLIELKGLAAKEETDTKSENAEWISTNDALASLLWCCMVATVKKRERSLRERMNNKAVVAEAKRWLKKVPEINNTTEPSEPVSTLAFVLNARSLMEPPIPRNFIVSCAPQPSLP